MLSAQHPRGQSHFVIYFAAALKQECCPSSKSHSTYMTWRNTVYWLMSLAALCLSSCRDFDQMPPCPSHFLYHFAFPATQQVPARSQRFCDVSGRNASVHVPGDPSRPRARAGVGHLVARMCFVRASDASVPVCGSASDDDEGALCLVCYCCADLKAELVNALVVSEPAAICVREIAGFASLLAKNSGIKKSGKRRLVWW